ncbi:hypothetical protein [Photorhabdus sp. MH8.4]
MFRGVVVAKELRALQGDYSAWMSEIQEKARMQGLDSLTPAEVRELPEGLVKQVQKLPIQIKVRKVTLIKVLRRKPHITSPEMRGQKEMS